MPSGAYIRTTLPHGNSAELKYCPHCEKMKRRDKDFYQRRNGLQVAFCKDCDKDASSLRALMRQVERNGLDWLEEYVYRQRRLLDRALVLTKELKKAGKR